MIPRVFCRGGGEGKAALLSPGGNVHLLLVLQILLRSGSPSWDPL